MWSGFAAGRVHSRVRFVKADRRKPEGAPVLWECFKVVRSCLNSGLTGDGVCGCGGARKWDVGVCLLVCLMFDQDFSLLLIFFSLFLMS